MDEANTRSLGSLPFAALASHADHLAQQELKPKELFERWERQQWISGDVSFEQDAVDFARRLPRRLREQLRATLSTFIVGEYTGLDLLSPVMLGAQDESDLVFLGTQIADEAQHASLMFRIGAEVLGLEPDPATMLRQAWDLAEQDHRELALVEGEVMRATVANPRDYDHWLRGVALFHLITEGVLAVSGQRAIVRALTGQPLLPGIRTTFAAMCRDESRHISFGLHALRTGLLEGRGEAVYDVIERVLPLALSITDGLQPTTTFAGSGKSGGTVLQTGVDSFRRAMRAIGADRAFVEHVVARSLTVAAAGRESRHPHPVQPAIEQGALRAS